MGEESDQSKQRGVALKVVLRFSYHIWVIPRSACSNLCNALASFTQPPSPATLNITCTHAHKHYGHAGHGIRAWPTSPSPLHAPHSPSEHISPPLWSGLLYQTQLPRPTNHTLTQLHPLFHLSCFCLPGVGGGRSPNKSVQVASQSTQYRHRAISRSCSVQCELSSYSFNRVALSYFYLELLLLKINAKRLSTTGARQGGLAGMKSN